MTGNTHLIKYGIHEEGSDFRAHVAVIERSLYFYERQKAIELIAENDFREVPVFTGKIKTALGLLVHPFDIPGMQRIDYPETWNGNAHIDEAESTHEKGEKAAKIVSWMLKKGLVKIPLDNRLIDDLNMQIRGVDITVHTTIKIQVKCDYHAGMNCDKERGITGNLFIQTHECNPYSSH